MRKYFENLYKKDCKAFYSELEQWVKTEQKKFIITANPEIFMQGEKDSAVNQMLSDSAVTTVADGIGIVKCAKLLNIDIPERIPGFEVSEKLLQIANENSSSLFLFGAKRDILEALCRVISEKFPNINIVGCEDGYTEDKDGVFEQIKTLSPDIVLVALGVPAQEKLIYKHLSDFKKGIFVGVGGSFDVLSGAKARAPKFFIKCNIEWLYRILKEPSRLKRFYNSNVKFIFAVKRESKIK